MWKTFFMSVLVLQLRTAMTQNVRPHHSTVTCRNVRCKYGTTCREVYDPQTQVVGPQCLHGVQPGNDHVCGNGGLPLLIIQSGVPVEVFCGRGPARIDCPYGYACNIAPDDRYAVCCPSSSGSVTPRPKPGQCPAIGIGEVGICAFMCNSDSECAGNLKCCPTPCGGTTCTSPQPPTPQTCASIVCTGGSCVESPEGPRCIPLTTLPSEKPGHCPPRPYACPPPDPTLACRGECGDDSGCPGDKKCCYTCSTCPACFSPITTPITPPPELCENPCPPGSRCVNTGIRCVTAACPTNRCVPVEPCSLPPETGPCEALATRYYYDASGPRPGCSTFTYGGCGGNSNNFRTLRECLRACVGNHRDGSYDA